MCGIFAYISKTTQDDSYFDNIKHRGPDYSKLMKLTCGEYNISLGFHRLSIIDLDGGDQPFVYKESNKKIYLICNGEIYNFKKLIEKYDLDTTSDCKVILELYLKGKSMNEIVEELDGEFAFIFLIIENNNINLYYARDRFGIRPLFYRIDENGIYLASELKSVIGGDGDQVEPRKLYYTNMKDENAYTYYYIGSRDELQIQKNKENFLKNIRDTLFESVNDRLQSERPLGALLSGGLDSSLICGIASKILAERGQRLTTFSIGMDEDSPDILNAREVAKHINSIHHEIIIPVEKWLENLENVIKQIETYDITTIRASTGQYLISKWISENTDIKVILNGDGSDELTSGYLYFYNAPDPDVSHFENLLLLNEIHNYDVLRVDRGISAFGLESRVPFLSHKFVNMYLNIFKLLRNPIKGERVEKYLLRKAFASENIIPESVLWRRKEAFSDGCSSVKKSWFEHIQDYISKRVTIEEYNQNNTDNRFPSQESYWYYKIFKQFYPKSQLKVIYWMPKWTKENNGDPSARLLKSLNTDT
jgi:asparagine synthase (glutamine-hydrolysing)